MTGVVDDLRLELRTRNNRLWHLIFDTDESVASFCRKYGYPQTTVGAYLNLSESPYSRKGVSPTAQRIADNAKMLAEDLFPRDLYSGLIPKRMVAEIPSSAYRGLTAARQLALPPVQDGTVLNGELRSVLTKALVTLTPKEERVIRARYGLNDDAEVLSLDEIGAQLEVGEERVRQIEAKALRKLRHPSRSRDLRPFLDSEHLKLDDDGPS